MQYNPPFGSQNPDAPFVNGIPGVQRGSAIPAEVAEYTQREILAVIKAAGLNPSNADLTQLLQAINLLMPAEVDMTALVQTIQQSGFHVASAGGTVNAITATFTPAITSTTLTSGMVLRVRAAGANTTTSPTFSPGSGVLARTIYKGSGQALVAGDIAGAGHWLELQYDSATPRWMLLNPTYPPSATAATATAQGNLGVGQAAPGNAPDTDWVRWVTPGSLAAKLLNISGVPLLSIIYHPASVVSGFLDISQDNGLLSRAAFPDAWQAISALPASMLLSDAAWQAEKTANSGVCGKFSTGDGSTTFRVPLIGKRFIRASGTGLPAGTAQGDAIRNITGSANIFGGSGWTATGALTSSNSGTQSRIGGYAYTGDQNIGIDASSVVPTADENRPVAVAYTPLLKMYGAATNAGQLDIAALVQGLSAKLDASVFEAQKTAGFLRCWTSGEYQIVANTLISATHGLNLANPRTALADLSLKCVVAEAGYAVGDFAQFAMCIYDANNNTISGGVQPRITTNTIEITIGGYGVHVIMGSHKNTGQIADLTLANWRLIFRIWHPVLLT